MRATTIFHHDSPSWGEEWLILDPDRSLTCHHENSGPRYLQRGPDAVAEELSVAEAVERWPEHAAAVDWICGNSEEESDLTPPTSSTRLARRC